MWPQPDIATDWPILQEPLIMKVILRLLFVLILAAAATDAFAQAPMLWHGARYGMSPKEVKAVIPQASPPAKPSHLAGGAVELLHLDGIEIARSQFSASFYFADNKLSQVTLTVPKKNFDEALLVFNDVTDALRAKYGKEITHTVQRGVLNRAEAIWMNGRTNIDLFLMSVREHTAFLNINYQVRLAKDADKL